MGTARGITVAMAGCLAAVAVGCGGESGSTTGEDPTIAEIEATLTKAFTDSTAEDCTVLYTDDALEQLLLGENVDPIENCEDRKNQDRPRAESIEITDLEVDGDSATAIVTPTGGGFDGARVDLALVESDGWRIDEFGQLDIYDRERFSQALYFDESEDIYAEGDVDCVRDFLANDVPIDKLERVYIDEDISPAIDSIVECIGNGSERQALMTISRRSLEASGFDTPLVDCVIRRSADAFDVGFEEFYEGSEASEELEEAVEQAALDCGGVIDSAST